MYSGNSSGRIHSKKPPHTVTVGIVKELSQPPAAESVETDTSIPQDTSAVSMGVMDTVPTSSTPAVEELKVNFAADADKDVDVADDVVDSPAKSILSPSTSCCHARAPCSAYNGEGSPPRKANVDVGGNCCDGRETRGRRIKSSSGGVPMNSMADALSVQSLLGFVTDFGVSGALLSALEVGDIFLSCDGGPLNITEFAVEHEDKYTVV